ncbi:hypothetical protein [Actinosynnema sp. NPDC023587]|uniref:hypothetical protein n=1 Tax=Actinosynnema sp. NPDC023587 TaxID=3154695 RepID=UPI00340C7450
MTVQPGIPQVWLPTYDRGLVRADLLLRIGAALLLTPDPPLPYGVVVQLHGDSDGHRGRGHEYVVTHADTLDRAQLVLLEILAEVDRALTSGQSGVIEFDTDGHPVLINLQHPAGPPLQPSIDPPLPREEADLPVSAEPPLWQGTEPLVRPTASAQPRSEPSVPADPVLD